MASLNFLHWNVLSDVLWISLVLTPGLLVARIEIAGVGKAWQDEIISLLLAGCLLIVAGLMAGSIKKLFE